MAKKNPIPNKSSFTIKAKVTRDKPSCKVKEGKDLRTGR